MVSNMRTSSRDLPSHVYYTVWREHDNEHTQTAHEWTAGSRNAEPSSVRLNGILKG